MGYPHLSGERAIFGQERHRWERDVADAIVKTTCKRCGDIELSPKAIELRICSVLERSVYAFTCPSCSSSIIKPADDQRIISLLRSVGVPSVGWQIPAEADEPRDGPPLSNDDLLDFMLDLEQPDWIDRLTAARSRS